MTCDTLQGVNILLKYHLTALTFWDEQCMEDSEQKDHSIIESVNYEGVYRTAPDTPGSLIKGVRQIGYEFVCISFKIPCTKSTRY